MSDLNPERLQAAADAAKEVARYEYEYSYFGDEDRTIANWQKVAQAAILSYGPTTDWLRLNEAIELLQHAYYTERVSHEDFDAIERFLVKVGVLESGEEERTGFPGYDLTEIRDEIAERLGQIPLKPKTAQEALRGIAHWFDLVDEALGLNQFPENAEVQNHLRDLANGLDGKVAIQVDLLKSLVDPDECWFDHHGGCQAHGYLSLEPGEACPQEELRAILEAAR